MAAGDRWLIGAQPARRSWQRAGLPHLDDDLALGASRFDVVHRRLGLVERKHPVHDRTNYTPIDERRDLAQLSALRPHEEEPKTDLEPLGLSPRAEAQDADDLLDVPRQADFVREGRVGGP